MATLKNLIKETKEATVALKDAKKKIWEKICKEICDTKGQTPNAKNTKVIKVLTNKKKKVFTNPDKFFCNMVENVRVFPEALLRIHLNWKRITMRYWQLLNN